jgi:two-component system NtrC family sensor kinase
LSIETNDEIQDLSEDFERMASEVARHRRRLESAVDERTRELRRTEAELSRIVSLSADGIVGLDPAGRVRLWNRGAEHLFGFTPKETRNRFLDDLILPDGPRGRREQAYLQRILEKTGAVIGHQTLRRTKAGELVPVGITQTLLEDENGQPTGSSVIFRDSRMQEQIQEQMRRSERLSAMSVMAAGLAHELNNPVAVLDNRLELMQREAATSDNGDSLLKDLGVLREQVRRVGSITGDLLRFARDDTDEISPLQVNDVVLRVVRLLDRVVAAEGVALRYELEEDLPLASASATSVETILVNLVLNASQACAPEGSITVVTRSRQRLKLVELEVRDDGPGVPDALRSRIFEPFFTTRADQGGTGLGLAVCRALMERNGGTIHLKGGNGGRGAVFVLGLPSAKPNDDD